MEDNLYVPPFVSRHRLSLVVKNILTKIWGNRKDIHCLHVTKKVLEHSAQVRLETREYIIVFQYSLA